MGVNKLCLLIVRRAGDKTAEITELGLGASATRTHTRTHQTITLALITTSQANISKIIILLLNYHIIIKLSTIIKLSITTTVVFVYRPTHT